MVMLLACTVCIIVAVTAVLACLLVFTLTILLALVTASAHVPERFSWDSVSVATPLSDDVSDYFFPDED